MSNPITRRKLLEDVGAAGARTLLAVGSGTAKLPVEESAMVRQTGQPTENEPGNALTAGIDLAAKVASHGQYACAADPIR
jgi:hypothetical protein